MVNTQVIDRALFGLEVETASARRRAQLSIEQATVAIVRLDAIATGHPLARQWRTIERALGYATALRISGEGASVPETLRALILPEDADAGPVRAAYEERRARWPGGAASGARALIRDVTTGERSLVAVAEAVAASVGRCVRRERQWRIDAVARSAAVESGGGGLDLGDVALATTFALRRSGLTVRRLGCVLGDPRAFVADLPWIERLETWAGSLTRHAAEAQERLRELERFRADAKRRLALTRKPQPIWRALDVALSSGSLWASRLASITGVHISNAWRTLEQAEELGLLVPVSSARRSRGDARVYAAQPVARAAGLLVAPAAAGQGSASAAEAPHELTQALADTDEALAELDRLLARTVP